MGGTSSSGFMVAMWFNLRWCIFAWIKQLLLWIPFLNRSFVILSSGRSGSTLLIQLLNCHPKIACKGELLNRNYLQEHNLRGASSHTLVNYILASLIPPKIWLSYTGFKLFNEQLEFCNLHLKDLLTALFWPRMIILYRESILETYISLEIAFKTDVWYSEGSGTNETVKIDWQNFEDYVMTERARWKRSMVDISAYSDCQVLFVSYEELTGDRNKVMNKTFNFLNIEMCHVEATSKKQNPLPLKEKIINYKQIEQKMLQNSGDYIITKEWLETIRLGTTGKENL